jgi:hypothetical protein
MQFMPWRRSSVALVSVFAVQCLLVAPVTAQAQLAGPQDASPDDTGGWLALFARGDINHDALPNKYRWWFDGHMRFFDDTDGFGQSIIRPGLGYALNDHAAVWAGYGWILSSPVHGSDFDEHRVWQQFTWSQRLEPVTLGLRSRLEQRFLETGSDTGWRFRQMLSWRHEMRSDPRYTLVLWNEVFIHLNDTNWGAVNGFDQNRLFMGFGRRPDPDSRSRVEIGYLYQRVDRSSGFNLNNHLLSINFYRSP